MMSDVFFWLRLTQGLATSAVASARAEWGLHSLRAQAEILLRQTADVAGIYPERAGEMWTDSTLACERVTCLRYGLDEVVTAPRKESALFDEAASIAKGICTRSMERFGALLDASVRGQGECGLSPTFLDFAATIAECGAKGLETDAKASLELAMTATEVMRGLLDASAPDEILRANATCVLFDKARIGTMNEVHCYEEGSALMMALAQDGVSGKLVGFPPILPDCFARLLRRFLRRARMANSQ